MAHLHEVKDKDLRFVLDENLNIINQSELRPLRRGDHNSEILSFTMPRYFEGHDMSLCNVRQVHYDNVYADRFTTKTNSSFDELKDFMIDPDDENKIVFIWQIQGDATELEGSLNFSLLFECTDETRAVEYRKLTDAFEGLTVGKSILNTEELAKKYADVLAAWKEELEAKIENAGGGAGATEEQLAQIEQNKEDIRQLSKIQADWNQNDSAASDFIKNRPFYEIPEVWNKVELVDDTWEERATCKLVSTPIEWAKDNQYRIRVDSIEYNFDGMEKFAGTSGTSDQDVYYIGATYLPFNKNMNFSEYPFCLLTTDFENIYAVFEDATLNHTVEFIESGATIHHLDPKYIKDMYYEEYSNAEVLSFTFSSEGQNNDNIYYACTVDEIAVFRELLDNSTEVTVSIDGVLYTLSFEGMSSDYYRLYNSNGSLVFEYYMGNSNRWIVLYYKNIGLTSAPVNSKVVFYKIGTVVHQLDEKYIPDTIARKEYVDNAIVANEATFIVNITENEDRSYSADKTFDEILEAYNNDKVLLCKEVYSTYDLYYQFDKYNNQSYGSVTVSSFNFIHKKVSSEGVTSYCISIGINSTIQGTNIDKTTGSFTFDKITNRLTNNTLTTTDKTIVGAINELHSELDENNVGSGSCFDIIINYDRTNNSAELTVGNYNTIMEKFNNKLPVFAMIYSFKEEDTRKLFYDYPKYIEETVDYIEVFNSMVDTQFQIFPDDHIEVNYIG